MEKILVIMLLEREIKRLKRSRIPLVKVRWNSRRGPEFTWEREDSFKQKYPQLFTNRASSSTTSNQSSATSDVYLHSVYTDLSSTGLSGEADYEGLSEGGIPRSCTGYDLTPATASSPHIAEIFLLGPENPQTPPVPQEEDEREPMFIQAHDPNYVPEPIISGISIGGRQGMTRDEDEDVEDEEGRGDTQDSIHPALIDELLPHYHHLTTTTTTIAIHAIGVDVEGQWQSSEIKPMTWLERSTLGLWLAELTREDTQDLYALLEDAQDSRRQYGWWRRRPMLPARAWARSIGLSQATHQELQTHRDHVYAHEDLYTGTPVAATAAGLSFRHSRTRLGRGALRCHQRNEVRRLCGCRLNCWHYESSRGELNSRLRLGRIPDHQEASGMDDDCPTFSNFMLLYLAGLCGGPTTHLSYDSILNNRTHRIRQKHMFVQALLRISPPMETGHSLCNFKGAEGVVGLTRWIEKMESVFNISGCAVENQIRTLGPEEYLAMTWDVLKKKDDGKDCPQFVANETEKIDKYLSGLPDNIYGNVKAAKPKTLDETIELANDLMDRKLLTYA
ncbi:hypothetical protein Tco_0343266 [Tanacetum coccineum]